MPAKAIGKRAGIAGSVDEYLARLDGPERTALEQLRAQIKQAAPEATELISYQIPTSSSMAGLLCTSRRSPNTFLSPW